MSSSNDSLQAHDGGSLFDEDEGEGMIGFDIDPRRREALERSQIVTTDSDRRLSRDLEEGFKDDSDDETRRITR